MQILPDVEKTASREEISSFEMDIRQRYEKCMCKLPD